ncbi:MAG: LptF/LptG family permease [Candidatus Paracaedimonas acanthamoebae]|uniref:LptF/LptG family permease n=1 Tax=Candidatus Paracaedimonas acanthamoebae TaxID=244581 RepID=A0A8J7PWM8_9PROT|nr:LptF/LptG family permease [Candidatus Paracaedimonas acanthamoebae]
MSLFSLILCKYLARNFLKWFFIVVFAVIAIIILVDLSELLRKSASKPDVNFKILFQILIFKFPSLIQRVLPFITFFSAILTFWMFNRTHELTVIRAVGVSIWQILSPLIIVTFLIGGIDLLLINPISSKMMVRYEQLDDYYLHDKKESLTVSETGLWISEARKDQQLIFHMKNVNLEKQLFKGIVITVYDQKNHFIESISATSALLKKGQLYLTNVWKVAPERLPEKYATLKFPTTISLDIIKNTGISPVSVSFWELPMTARLLEASGISGLKYILHWHALLSRWGWLSAMVILAASCSLRPLRQQGMVYLMTIGAFVAFLLYFLRDITYALGASGKLPIVLSAWLPFGISIVTGITLLLYSEDG